MAETLKIVCLSTFFKIMKQILLDTPSSACARIALGSYSSVARLLYWRGQNDKKYDVHGLRTYTYMMAKNHPKEKHPSCLEIYIHLCIMYQCQVDALLNKIYPPISTQDQRS